MNNNRSLQAEPPPFFLFSLESLTATGLHGCTWLSVCTHFEREREINELVSVCGRPSAFTTAADCNEPICHRSKARSKDAAAAGGNIAAAAAAAESLGDLLAGPDPEAERKHLHSTAAAAAVVAAGLGNPSD